MGKNRAFSLYDIEEFLKEAGAERVHEKAVVSFERELETTVNEIISEAKQYANYAGRRKLVKYSDITLVNQLKVKKGPSAFAAKLKRVRRKAHAPAVMLSGARVLPMANI